MMMMIVDLYSALHRASLLRYVSPVHCEKECLQCWSKRSNAERWITEMIRQQVPDHRTCCRICIFLVCAIISELTRTLLR